MEDGPGNAVAALAPVELRQRGPPFGFVINAVQHVQRLVDPTEFRDGLRQSGWPVANLEGMHDAGGRYAAQLEGAGQAQHVVPIRACSRSPKQALRSIVNNCIIELRFFWVFCVDGAVIRERLGSGPSTIVRSRVNYALVEPESPHHVSSYPQIARQSCLHE